MAQTNIFQNATLSLIGPTGVTPTPPSQSVIDFILIGLDLKMTNKNIKQFPRFLGKSASAAGTSKEIRVIDNRTWLEEWTLKGILTSESSGPSALDKLNSLISLQTGDRIERNIVANNNTLTQSNVAGMLRRRGPIRLEYRASSVTPSNSSVLFIDNLFFKSLTMTDTPAQATRTSLRDDGTSVETSVLTGEAEKIGITIVMLGGVDQ